MSPQPAEPDLRDRLGGALPDSYPAVDLDTVLASGRRTVRRRRVGGLVAAAAAALVVAVGATQLAGGPRVTAPQPARTSSLPGVATASVNLNTADDTTLSWAVTIGAADAAGQRTVTWQALGSTATVGSSISDHDRRASWGFGDGSVVLGELPDEQAQKFFITDRPDNGYTNATVVGVPGSGWSVFAITYGKPSSGPPFTRLLWLDGQGRPVDQDGGVGVTGRVADRTVWLSHDGSVLGDDDGFGPSSTPLDPSGENAMGAYPRLTQQDQDGSGTFCDVTIRLRPEAVSATLVFTDGRRVPVDPVRLGGWNVAVSAAIRGPQVPTLARVEWTSAGGVQHDDAVPPLSRG